MEEVEIKSILDSVMTGFTKIFQSVIFQQILLRFVLKKYDDGIESIEKQFQINFVRNDESLEFLNMYVAGVVGNTIDNMNAQLRQEIQRAQLDGVGVKELKRRVKEEFNSKQMMNRLKTTIRTEGSRAGNLAQMDAARQTGFPMVKYLDVVIDAVTSNICLAENKKYGSKDKAIPLEEDFIIRAKVGKKMKTFRKQQPPFHINCRTNVRFMRK